MTTDRVTHEDRLRLHVHDPDTFEFSFEDAEGLADEIDGLRSELLALRALALSIDDILAALDSPPDHGGGEGRTSPLGPQTPDERLCFERGMQQWRASLKRPDMTEEDRVKGALEAYCRQAFALPSLPTQESEDGR